MNIQSIRRTKIVATLGPATDDPQIIQDIIANGCNVVRLNFSHDTHERHQERIKLVRSVARSMGKPVGVLADLQGPKLRIARFKDGKVTLTAGQTFALNAALDTEAGDETQVGLDYKNLPHDVNIGDVLLLSDGLISLEVTRVTDEKVICEVKIGGILSNNKGINRVGGGLSADPLTEKDLKDIAFLVEQDIDFIALSFVKRAEDVLQLRKILRGYGKEKLRIVAKMETVEAINNMESIIDVSDAVMVARGDLGVEIGFAELPGVQKNIIHRARAQDKAVITATEMMASMVSKPTPSRAEVSDVANAALDGTDAVMLSEESAVGKYPVQTVKAASDICLAAERQKRAKLSRHRMNVQFERVDETIAMATMYIANHMDLQAIVALTESGSTPLWMSRIRSSVPIFAFSRHVRTCGVMTLYRGVHPILFDFLDSNPAAISRAVIQHLIEKSMLKAGDKVLITKGEHLGVGGRTDTLQILNVDSRYFN